MVLAACVVLERDAEVVLELGADISKYSEVQEERRMLKRVFDKCECGVKGRCKTQVQNAGAKGKCEGLRCDWSCAAIAAAPFLL